MLDKMKAQTSPGRSKRSPSAPLRLLPWGFKRQHAQSQRHLCDQAKSCLESAVSDVGKLGQEHLLAVVTCTPLHQQQRKAGPAYALQEDVKRAALEGHPQPIGWLRYEATNVRSRRGDKEAELAKTAQAPGCGACNRKAQATAKHHQNHCTKGNHHGPCHEGQRTRPLVVRVCLPGAALLLSCRHHGHRLLSGVEVAVAKSLSKKSVVKPLVDEAFLGHGVCGEVGLRLHDTPCRLIEWPAGQLELERHQEVHDCQPHMDHPSRGGQMKTSCGLRQPEAQLLLCDMALPNGVEVETSTHGGVCRQTVNDSKHAFCNILHVVGIDFRWMCILVADVKGQPERQPPVPVLVVVVPVDAADSDANCSHSTLGMLLQNKLLCHCFGEVVWRPQGRQGRARCRI
mmetsp:Transcript_54930/g.128977  ORF Transcript_54930/g.128977 Transcript_54930/m.128977 type:complete len:399 (+) Transcript_54930:17-1213(+)